MIIMIWLALFVIAGIFEAINIWGVEWLLIMLVYFTGAGMLFITLLFLIGYINFLKKQKHSKIKGENNDI